MNERRRTRKRGKWKKDEGEENVRSLTHTGIHPEKPLPSKAIVKLREFGAFAGTAGSQLGTEDSQHRFPAVGRWASALLRHAVHRATLLVVLQLYSK